MRSRYASIGCAAFLCVLAQVAGAQAPSSGAPTQTGKEQASGSRAGRDLEKSDGKIDDPTIIRYLQRLENKLAHPMGAPPAEVRLTRSSLLYVSLPDNSVLYISGGLLQRIENEAELAGLLAHELAHTKAAREVTPKGEMIEVVRTGCVLQANPATPDTEEARWRLREGELSATAAAVACLRAAGYDPAAVLDLFSKLAYEHPAWAKAIVPDDLLALRTKTEAEAVPPGGFRVDSSDFVEVHALLETVLSRSR
jgi:predicted Zn-dependent protease